MLKALQWCHHEHDGVWNHRRADCLLNRLFRRRSNKTSKPRATGLCEGNFNSDRGIPRTCFYLMKLSYIFESKWFSLSCLFSTKPLSPPVLAHGWLDHWEQISVKIASKENSFYQENCFQNPTHRMTFICVLLKCTICHDFKFIMRGSKCISNVTTI